LPPRIPTRPRTPIHTGEPRARDAPAGDLQLLRLLHLASPALPIGGFHFSQGLEYAVDAGWVRDEAGALEWIGGVAQSTLATLDLPVLGRLRAACDAGDFVALTRWNRLLVASRETAELRAEDRHLGAALLRVLAELDLDTAPLSTAFGHEEGGICHATTYAFACACWRIDGLASVQAYAWAWAENQVLAAVKLVPLGQSAGQRMLHALTARLGALTSRAIDLADSDIGVCSFAQSIASARHETQYTRLFRS